MKLLSRTRSMATALLVSVTPLAAISTMARAADCPNLSWTQDKLSKLDAAIAGLEQDDVKRQTPASQSASSSQKQLSEFDAAIAALEQDVGSREAGDRAKGEALLKEIRASREAYRAKQPAIHVMRSAQAAEIRQSPDGAASAFWSKVDAYLDAVNADVATRQAAMQTKFVGN